MSKKLLLLVPAFAVVLAGCSTGDTPTETVQVQQQPQAGQGNGMQGQIESNPNLPPAAKNAILGGGQGK